MSKSKSVSARLAPPVLPLQRARTAQRAYTTTFTTNGLGVQVYVLPLGQTHLPLSAPPPPSPRVFTRVARLAASPESSSFRGVIRSYYYPPPDDFAGTYVAVDYINIPAGDVEVQARERWQAAWLTRATFPWTDTNGTFTLWRKADMPGEQYRMKVTPTP